MFHRFFLALTALGVFLGCGGSSPRETTTATPTPTPAPTPTSAGGAGTLPTGREYAIGSPTLTDLWVDPTAGSDSNDGTSRVRALRTVAAAWNKIPRGTALTGTGYRIQLVAGTHTGIPNYWEDRLGTAQFPVILNAVDGPGSATLSDINMANCRYLYFIGVNVLKSIEGGDTLHFERCDHILVRQCTIASVGRRLAQEALKVNQTQHLYVESSDISGAGDNAVDCVAVQYGHFLNNKIHDSEDWAMYLKGGSAYFWVEGNELYDAGTGGFTAGQGTGIEYMTLPWVHYEAYDIKAVNNVIHDVQGAALGVNGGYNILLAYNTALRCGARSHMLEIVYGFHECDGETENCRTRLDAGGWGTMNREPEIAIGNRNVFVYNNIFANATGTADRQFLAVYAPRSNSGGVNAPHPAVADTNLQIRGNIFWNGGLETPLGVGEEQGCRAENPTCNTSQLTAENAFGTLNPQLGTDFRAGASLAARAALPLPDFDWANLPARPNIPQGTLANTVTRRRDGSGRSGADRPGAY